MCDTMLIINTMVTYDLKPKTEQSKIKQVGREIEITNKTMKMHATNNCDTLFRKVMFDG